MRRWILAVTAGLLAVAVAGFFIYRMMQGGMYDVGHARVARNADTSQPKQVDGFIDVGGGVRLYHRGYGSGRPAIFVHGGPAMPARDPWPAVDLLRDVLQLHFYDQRGSGRSTRPIQRVTEENTYQAMQQVEGTLGLGQQVADVDRVRAALGTERVILIGHSYGGLVASLYAAEFPERVEALILVAPAKLVRMPIQGEDLFARVRAKLPEDQRAGYDALLKRTFDLGGQLRLDEDALGELYDEFGRYFAAASGPLPDSARPAGRTGGFATMATYLSLGLRHDYAPALARVNIPVLVVHGGADLLPAADSDRFASYFPRAERLDLAGSGHFPFAEQPEEFAAAVKAFLAKHALQATAQP